MSSNSKSKQKPYLSIIIPTLNEEGFIGDLLQQIINQEMNYEIIVSDSGSSDNTAAIVKKFIELYPEKAIRFIHAPIKGVSIARNNGAAHAKADYILFLDADTAIPENFLANVYLEVRRRNLDAAGCYIEPNSGKFVDKAIWSFCTHCIHKPLQYTKNPGCAGAGLIVKRRMHKKIGGFNIRLDVSEDLDYIKKISRIGKFRMLKSDNTKIIFNMRRFDKEGRVRMWFKWAVMGSFYLLNTKGVKLDYEFGKFEGKKHTATLIKE